MPGRQVMRASERSRRDGARVPPTRTEGTIDSSRNDQHDDGAQYDSSQPSMAPTAPQPLAPSLLRPGHMVPANPSEADVAPHAHLRPFSRIRFQAGNPSALGLLGALQVAQRGISRPQTEPCAPSSIAGPSQVVPAKSRSTPSAVDNLTTSKLNTPSPAFQCENLGSMLQTRSSQAQSSSSALSMRARDAPRNAPRQNRRASRQVHPPLPDSSREGETQRASSRAAQSGLATGGSAGDPVHPGSEAVSGRIPLAEIPLWIADARGHSLRRLRGEPELNVGAAQEDALAISRRNSVSAACTQSSTFSLRDRCETFPLMQSDAATPSQSPPSLRTDSRASRRLGEGLNSDGSLASSRAPPNTLLRASLRRAHTYGIAAITSSSPAGSRATQERSIPAQRSSSSSRSGSMRAFALLDCSRVGVLRPAHGGSPRSALSSSTASAPTSSTPVLASGRRARVARGARSPLQPSSPLPSRPRSISRSPFGDLDESAGGSSSRSDTPDPEPASGRSSDIMPRRHDTFVASAEAELENSAHLTGPTIDTTTTSISTRSVTDVGDTVDTLDTIDTAETSHSLRRSRSNSTSLSPASLSASPRRALPKTPPRSGNRNRRYSPYASPSRRGDVRQIDENTPSPVRRQRQKEAERARLLHEQREQRAQLLGSQADP
ncbi:hypothetical protein IE81DRAFT_198086 [Ceraceosorus guamensis]|uniref:Uncharacterized protein n=1 Tax=Ceraceosorus guamensis TaxID=1522189 RepID=A0A316VTM8_9BASI|nr:hypothetical protein IE81DRAFT_198086 [Ceraceosorus guamensis]PWN40956.1 hypothetical protein IE81DRAFT_198086 [Ceraceosorus guamensis]